MNNNPFKIQLELNSKNKTAIYIAPEDLRSKLSGGHIESITDASLLSEIYKKVIVIYPDEKIKKNNNLYQDVLKRSNITFKSVSKNKNLLYKFLLSENRASHKEIIKIIKSYHDSHIFIGCHRNWLVHFFIFKKIRKKEIFFKSYGSIFLHNFDNLYAIFRTRCIEPLFLKRLISTFFYFFIEHFSYILSNKIFITRDLKNVRRNLFGNFYHFLYGEKSIYRCSGPYWYYLNKTNNDLISNAKKYKNSFITIGSLGDNTFPTAILGLIFLLKELDKANKIFKNKILIKLAGKINQNTTKAINDINFKTNINVEFIGYIENKNNFLSTLDGMLLPVSGGSAMPIKAIEAMLYYKKPILVTNYISHSCSGFFENSKNIFYLSNEYLRILSKKN